MDFKEGGQWLYSMVGPEGDSKFGDENGNPKDDFAAMYWLVEMREDNGVTTVNVTITFDDTAGLQQMVNMGFKMGFTMGLNQLEELLG